jgi:hypothetical protein
MICSGQPAGATGGSGGDAIEGRALVTAAEFRGGHFYQDLIKSTGKSCICRSIQASW